MVLNTERDQPQRTFKLKPGRPLESSIRLRSADVLMNAQLRLYVDEWLDTGRTGEGVEDPRQRDLTNAPNACWAVERFAQRGPLGLKATRDGLQIKFPSEFVLGGIPPGGEAPPLDIADRYFALFFLCDWRLKLAKCRHCERYFELKHWNRSYKKGTLCATCVRSQSLEGAKASTAAARKDAKSVLYRLAAERFSRQLAKKRDWRKDPELKTKIVQYLNERIKRDEKLKSVYPQGRTLKWLGWRKNQLGIEDVIKKGTHAKS